MARSTGNQWQPWQYNQLMHGSALYGHLSQAHMHRLLFNKILLLYCLTIFINDSTGQKNQLQLVRLESIEFV